MLTAVIIDDEASSRSSLVQKLNAYCPGVVVVGECEDAEQGIQMVEEKKPSLIFLDVEMPRMSGFTMLQHIDHKSFEVIFITAYDYYAIKAIRVSALDYLVKPVAVHDLVEAVEKADRKYKREAGNQRIEVLLQNLLQEKKELQRLVIPSMDGLQFVETDTIVYLEASNNYTVFHLSGHKKLTVTKILKEYEELLPGAFIRIHHSCIINKNQVEKYIRGEGGRVIMKDGTVLDVARRKKEEFLKAIGYRQ